MIVSNGSYTVPLEIGGKKRSKFWRRNCVDYFRVMGQWFAFGQRFECKDTKNSSMHMLHSQTRRKSFIRAYLLMPCTTSRSWDCPGVVITLPNILIFLNSFPFVLFPFLPYNLFFENYSFFSILPFISNSNHSFRYNPLF